jgi:hypothetical protein
MSAADVRQRFGAPAEIRPYEKVESVKAEIWVYHGTEFGGVREVGGGVREVPYVDPLSGQTKMMQEPLTRLERMSIRHTVQLLMIEGRVAELSRTRDIDRSTTD